jgi:hypothetical protein
MLSEQDARGRVQSTGQAVDEWRATSFLPMKRAALILGVSRTALYNLEKTGVLRFRRVGGRSQVVTGSLAAFVDADTKWTPSPTAGAAARARRRELAKVDLSTVAAVAS